jgi:Uma2 family endonuclease
MTMSTVTNPLPGTTYDPHYPDSDGQPMGETGLHVLAIFHLFEALWHFFRNRADIHVAADMFLYYEQGNPAACKAPDVMVAKGVAGNHLRRSFRTWEEGVAPTVIFEVTSKKTRHEDDVVKPRVYAALGVAEYFVFDPEEDENATSLWGFRLRDGAYEQMPRDADGRLISHELGLALEPEFPLLRLVDLRTGRRLLTYNEQADQVEDVQREAREARREADDMQREADGAKREAEVAQRKVKEAQREAEVERARAAELERELARLRAASNRPQPPV